MCGFVGFIGGLNSVEPQKLIANMAEQIKHRGPDDGDFFINENAAFGFRRLSIIDLEGGRQPIFNEDGTKVLLFNGEIYNFMPLREELLACGHIFKTKTDSEVLLHGYEQWGAELLTRLRGMFAFVIYDTTENKLFAARDFFGIKPFYYYKNEETFIFGSEIKSFLPHPAFKKQLNTDALEEYLTFQYSALPETFFKGVFRLPAAHYFEYTPGAGYPICRRYWLPWFEPAQGRTLEEWANAVETVFDDSVQAHKISDVEVGSFLSSGVDSSYVACSANVDKTFTVGFNVEGNYDETSYAKELSALIPVKNISKTIEADEYFDSVPKIMWHMDEPLADPSALALYFVSKLASEYVKVTLSGEGADEIFGGYNVYKEPLMGGIYAKLPFFLRRAVGKICALLPARRGLNYFVRKGQRLHERFIGNAFMFTEKERKALLTIKTNAKAPQDIVKPFYEIAKNADDITKMQFLDLNMWMTGDILLKADKMSMANSLELRVPFLDKKIMELASKIPTDCRVSPQNTKLALRKAAIRRMPEKWSQKKKLGFPVPIRVWLKEEKYFETVKDKLTGATAEKFFDIKKLEKLLFLHKSGKSDNSRKIWTVYAFLVWYDVYFGEGIR